VYKGSHCADSGQYNEPIPFTRQLRETEIVDIIEFVFVEEFSVEGICCILSIRGTCYLLVYIVIILLL